MNFSHANPARSHFTFNIVNEFFLLLCMLDNIKYYFITACGLKSNLVLKLMPFNYFSTLYSFSSTTLVWLIVNPSFLFSFSLYLTFKIPPSFHHPYFPPQLTPSSLFIFFLSFIHSFTLCLSTICM